ncbi:aminopeptidase [soil metagenome]
MKRAFPTLILLLLLTGACSPLYVLRAGWEEAKILARREPIPEVIADPRTPEDWRAKLALVLRARDFAADSLGLDAGESYTTFSELDSDTLALVVSAAYRDRFEAYTWWFPIVGRVPYKGFFSERAAFEAAADLQQEGFDTYIRPTSAFSTLGWFNDPLVSSLMRYDSVQLVNTVAHELFHNTFFAAGQVQFNESAASFVGSRAAIDFFCRRAPGSSACAEARSAWADDLLFSDFLDGLVAELEALYARADLTSEQKIALREQVFDRARARFAEEVQPRMRTSGIAGFATTPLNNATLLARRLYYHRLGLFEGVYRRYGEDLPRKIAAIVRAAEGAEDAYAAVDSLVASRDTG